MTQILTAKKNHSWLRVVGDCAFIWSFKALMLLLPITAIFAKALTRTQWADIVVGSLFGGAIIVNALALVALALDKLWEFSANTRRWLQRTLNEPLPNTLREWLLLIGGWGVFIILTLTLALIALFAVLMVTPLADGWRVEAIVLVQTAAVLTALFMGALVLGMVFTIFESIIRYVETNLSPEDKRKPKEP